MTGVDALASVAATGEWVLLSYRLPREPSSGPRTTLWRRLERLGVAQPADGVVALPADARTRQQWEWLAEDVTGAGGTAGIWMARPVTPAQERELATSVAGARNASLSAARPVSPRPSASSRTSASSSPSTRCSPTPLRCTGGC